MTTRLCPPVAQEAVVIGGGPAGSAAAVQLARAGRDVSLLERKPGAHHKVCGEFVSWEAVHLLHELGVDLPRLGARPIHRVRLYNGEAILEAELPSPGWSLSRYRLDAALLKQAEQAGATVHRGVVVRRLSPLGQGWVLNTTQKGEDGTQDSELRANTVFLASGKRDLRPWRRTRHRRNRDLIGLKMHLRLSPAQQDRLRDSVEIHLFNGGYAGLEPVEKGAANLCFLISKSIYHACNKSWPALLSWLGSTSSHMRACLTGSASLWPEPLFVYGTPYGYLHHPESSVPGLFRLGDQMAVIPSFAGDGIAIALHSAFLAARIHASEGSSTLYHQQARNDFQRPVRNAELLAGLLAHAQGRRVVFMLARQWPGLMQNLICRIRLARI